MILILCQKLMLHRSSRSVLVSTKEATKEFLSATLPAPGGKVKATESFVARNAEMFRAPTVGLYLIRPERVTTLCAELSRSLWSYYDMHLNFYLSSLSCFHCIMFVC